MQDSKLIDRVRDIRRIISEEHGHDTEKLVDHYRKLEKQSKRKIFRKNLNRVARQQHFVLYRVG